jgi:hypothetical protein
MTANGGGWTAIAVEALAPRQLLLLPCCGRVDQVAGDAQALHDLLIDYA